MKTNRNNIQIRMHQAAWNELAKLLDIQCWPMQQPRFVYDEVANLLHERNALFLQLGGLQSCIAEELKLSKTPLDDNEVRPILRAIRQRLGKLRYVLLQVSDLLPYVEKGYVNIQNDGAAKTIKELKNLVIQLLYSFK